MAGKLETFVIQFLAAIRAIETLLKYWSGRVRRLVSSFALPPVVQHTWRTHIVTNWNKVFNVRWVALILSVIYQLIPCFPCFKAPTHCEDQREFGHYACPTHLAHKYNRIVNSKYTALSFLSQSILTQFSRPLNLYFLLVAMLQLDADLTPVNPSTTIVPLVVAFLVTAAKDAFDDLKRAVQDEDFNSRVFWVSKASVCHGPPPPPPHEGLSVKRLEQSPALVDKAVDQDMSEKPPRSVKPLEDNKAAVCKVQAPPEKPVSVRDKKAQTTSRLMRLCLSVKGLFVWVGRILLRMFTRRRRPVGQSWLRSGDISVGDMVCVRRDEEIPCDMIVICVPNLEGICYLETASLDGETDMKPRAALRGVQQYLSRGIMDPMEFTGKVSQCQAPNERTNDFKAYLEFNGVQHSVTVENFLQMSCVLRKTAFVYGLAVYTGNETKMGMSKGSPPAKWSQLDRRLTKYSIGLFCCQITGCIILGLTGASLLRNSSAWYLAGPVPNDPEVVGYFTSVVFPLRFFLLSSVVIPISFKMTLDVFKLAMARFISWDSRMSSLVLEDGVEHLRYAMVNNTNVAEDLGQVQYILSDKTGTLTENKMSFKMCALGMDCYERKEASSKSSMGDNVDACSDVAIYASVGVLYNQCDKIRDLLRCIARNRNIRNVIGEPITSPTASVKFSTAMEPPSPVSPSSGTYNSVSFGSPPAIPASGRIAYCPNCGLPTLPHLAMLARVLTLCNSMDTEYVTTPQGTEIRYSYTSTDEYALIQGACRMGVRLVYSRLQYRIIDFGGKLEGWQLVHNLGFTSDRKRQSIVACRVPINQILTPEQRAESLDRLCSQKDDAYEFPMNFRHAEGLQATRDVNLNGVRPTYACACQLRTRTPVDSEGKMLLLSKGADDVLIPLINSVLDTTSSPTEVTVEAVTPRMLKDIRRCLSRFASRGLRTMVIAYRVINAEEFTEWASTLLKLERENPSKRDEVKAQFYDSLERGFTYAGATAIQDQLQEHVGETIVSLQAAGIGVWMLTGDKEETACNIGRACEFMREDDTVFRLQDNTVPQILGRLTVIKQDLLRLQPCNNLSYLKSDKPDGGVHINMNLRPRNLSRRSSRSSSAGFPVRPSHASLDNDHIGPQKSASQPSFVLIVTGPALSHCSNPYVRDLFLEVALFMRSVICCRATQSMKRDIVLLLNRRKYKTLAIGDGGNDVAMIQAAHLGVGILGCEGQQAARAADFSIWKFCHLKPLLFLHGHYSYHRAGYIVLYQYYKSMLLAFSQIAFNAFTMFSGVSYWDSWGVMAWNGFYTLLPSLAFVFDRILPRKWLLQVPELYAHCQQSRDLTGGRFAFFIMRGMLQAVAALLISLAVFGPHATFPVTGYTYDSTITMTTTYSALICTQCLMILIESHSVTIVNHIAIWIGMLMTYFFSSIIISRMIARKFLDPYTMPRTFHDEFASFIDVLSFAPYPYFLTVFLITAILTLPQVTLQMFMTQYRPRALDMVRKFIQEADDEEF